MNCRPAPFKGAEMHFAEILDKSGKRLHVGCIMAAGEDWVEVSLPQQMQLPAGVSVRFWPAPLSLAVNEEWRMIDRVGFAYVDGRLPDGWFAGIPAFNDPRPASIRARRQGAHRAPAYS